MQIVAKKQPSAFALRLRSLRESHGYTQVEMAEEVGVGIQTYMRWERGDTEPTYSALCDLAAALGVTLDAFQKQDG